MPLGLQPYQKETLTQVFPVNIPKILRTSVLGPWVKVNVILHQVEFPLYARRFLSDVVAT